MALTLRRVAIATLLAITMLLAFEAPAQAASTTCSTGNVTGYNCVISSDLDCANGYQVRLKIHTFDFGFFDSTGTTYLRITSGGTTYLKTYSNVEHDGVTRYWYTGRNNGTHFTADFSGLSNVGSADFHTACVPV